MRVARIEQLTWLRGIAAYLVIISHSIRATEVKYSSADEPSYFLPLGLLDLGSYAVALFFVLSGCTLWLSNGHISSGREILAYYVKRILRIWPAFLASMAVYLAFFPVFQHFFISSYTTPASEYLTQDLSIENVFRYIFLIFNITGPSGLLNGAYWSMPVEFQYYLLLPILVISVRLIGHYGPLLIGIALYLAFNYQLINLDRYEVLSLGYTFCGGVLIGYIYERHPTFRFRRIWGLLLLSCCIGIASAIYNNFLPLPPLPWIGTKWNWYGVMAIITVAVALFTDFELHGTRLANFMHSYGEISYSTYLFHNLFVYIAILLIVNLGLWGDSQKLFFTLTFTTIATYYFSIITYKWIERPGISVARHLARRIVGPFKADDPRKLRTSR